MLVGSDLVVTVDSGGNEDGAASWAGSPTTISCALRSFEVGGEAVTVDTTTRCATQVTNFGIRSNMDVTLSIDVPDSGTPVFGVTQRTYWKFAVDFIAAGSTYTYETALRRNVFSSDADGRQVQNCTFKVLAVS